MKISSMVIVSGILRFLTIVFFVSGSVYLFMLTGNAWWFLGLFGLFFVDAFNIDLTDYIKATEAQVVDKPLELTEQQNLVESMLKKMHKEGKLTIDQYNSLK